jgi:hypothetical protein
MSAQSMLLKTSIHRIVSCREPYAHLHRPWRATSFGEQRYGCTAKVVKVKFDRWVASRQRNGLHCRPAATVALFQSREKYLFCHFDVGRVRHLSFLGYRP